MNLGPLADEAGSTSTTLLDQVRSRDPVAWRLFVDRYGPLVGYWLRRLNVPTADVPDLFQNVFIAVLNGIGTYKRTPSQQFRGWLWVLTRNKARDHFRKLGRQPGAFGDQPGVELLAAAAVDSGDEPAPSEINDQLLKRALATIERTTPPANWQAFWRTVIRHEPVASVAADLGMTAAHVRVIRWRILKRLRDLLGPTPFGDDEP